MALRHGADMGSARKDRNGIVCFTPRLGLLRGQTLFC